MFGPLDSRASMLALPRLNIVHVLTHYDATRGGGIQALLLATAQRAAGHDVAVIANKRRPNEPLDPTFEPWLRSGLTIDRYQMMDPFGLWAPPSEILRFRRWLAQRRPDVIHVHRDSALLFTYLATMFRETRAVIAQRGTTMTFNSRPIGMVFRSKKIHRVIAVADAVKDSLVEQGVTANRVSVVYGSFDVDRFDPARTDRKKLRAELGLRNDQQLVIMVGELNHKKSPNTYIDACAKLIAERDNVVCVHVGTGKKKRRKRYEEIAAKGCGERFKFLGWRRDIPEVYAAADVAVNSSSAGEGLTGAIREALAMECAVVATAVDGNPEVVKHGVTGLLVPRLDADAMAAAIGALLDDPARGKNLGRAGRQLVLSMMHPDVRVANVERVYREVLAERGHAQPERQLAAGG